MPWLKLNFEKPFKSPMKLDLNDLEDHFGSNLNFEGNFGSLRASHLNCIY